MASTGTGIDPGAHTAKIVQGRSKGDRFQLLCAAEAVVPTSAEDGRPRGDVTDTLRDALGQLGLKRSRAVVGITGRDLMLRYTQLPHLPPHRIKVLMDFEVREIAEKVEGEVAADFSILPGEVGDGGEQMAIVAMVKEASLEPRLKTSAEGGASVLHAAPNAVAVFNAFLKFGDFRQGETTLLLDVGAESTDLAIQQDGDLLFARNLSFGGRTFTEALMGHFGVNYKRAEELKIAKGRLPSRAETRFEDGLAEKVARTLSGTLGQLVGLVQSSISFCKVQWKQPNLRVDRVVVSGGGSLLAGFSGALSEALGISVDNFDLSDRLDLSQLPEDEAERVTAEPRRFAVPLGLAQMALDRRFFRVEVVPAALRRRREIREKLSFLVAAGVVAVAYLVVSGVTGSKNLRAAEERNRKIAVQEQERTRNTTKYEGYVSDNTEKAERAKLLHGASLSGFALARTVESVQTNLEGVEGLWIQAIEVKLVRGRAKGEPERPVVVLEGAGDEVDEDVGSVCDRFAAALKKDLLDRWGARATHAFNRRTSTFTIQVDFEPEAPDTPDGETPGGEEEGR